MPGSWCAQEGTGRGESQGCCQTRPGHPRPYTLTLTLTPSLSIYLSLSLSVSNFLYIYIDTYVDLYRGSNQF